MNVWIDDDDRVAVRRVQRRIGCIRQLGCPSGKPGNTQRGSKLSASTLVGITLMEDSEGVRRPQSKSPQVSLEPNRFIMAIDKQNQIYGLARVPEKPG